MLFLSKDTQEWSNINDPSWSYVGTGVNLSGRAGLFHQDEDLFRRGFINVYSQASIEEDVNMYVFAVISQRSVLFSTARRHNRVRQKLILLTRFYEGIKQQLRIAGDFEFLARLNSTIGPNTRALSDFDAGSGRQR